jgi:hypothetical protein
MIQSSRSSVVVLTDHGATRGIYDRTSLNTADVTKANMRLVHASVYLSQFDLDIRHYPGRLNIVPDALSRLDAVPEDDISHDGELERILFSAEVVIDPKFKQKLIDGLWEDSNFARALSNLCIKKDDGVTEPNYGTSTDTRLY